MADSPAERTADTRVPIHPPIAARWSPRAFDPDAVLSTEQLIALLEAARWAPTWGHRQPVRFIVGVRRAGAERPGDQPGDEDPFATLSGLLRRGNAYAKAASALILLCADEGEDERTALYSGVDAGAAMASLIIEAVSRGLIAHPMAGFDVDGARQAFGLDAALRPLMIIAIGSLADYAQVADEVAERDRRPRERLPLEQIVLNGSGFAGLG